MLFKAQKVYNKTYVNQNTDLIVGFGQVGKTTLCRHRIPSRRPSRALDAKKIQGLFSDGEVDYCSTGWILCSTVQLFCEQLVQILFKHYNLVQYSTNWYFLQYCSNNSRWILNNWLVLTMYQPNPFEWRVLSRARRGMTSLWVSSLAFCTCTAIQRHGSDWL